MKIKVLFLTMAISILLASAAYAHPPSDIKITFDPETKILQAIIYHSTSNPAQHYINKIDVALNGKEIISQEISREDNNLTQTASYLISDAKPGDVLSVEGYCSISGKLGKEITVRENANK
ncbi:MAG: hypothetical protein PHY73_03330 [Candidatus Omnitrophica bacterium]|nr:hypothetical protein [Candidatus Omnitrophota bacterium]